MREISTYPCEDQKCTRSTQASQRERQMTGQFLKKRASTLVDAAKLIGLSVRTIPSGKMLPSGGVITEDSTGVIVTVSDPDQFTDFWTAVDSLEKVQPKD